MRPLIGGYVDLHRLFLGRMDRGYILLVVYTAFSAAVIEGLWHRLSGFDLALITGLDILLLVIVLVLTTLGARLGGFSTKDETVLVFCGSKKSLASGVPIAGALFAPDQVGRIILPLMLFHQMQLIVCAPISPHYAMRADLITPKQEKIG